MVDYTALPLTAIPPELTAIAHDAHSWFGALNGSQLNWKPDAKQWSVAQCLDHLLTTNRLMQQSARSALDGQRPSIWLRLPVLPGVFGRLLVKSMTPQASRKFTAVPIVQPSASNLEPDIVARFVEQQQALAGWIASLDPGAARTIMASPLAGAVSYGVLDGCRLIAAHDRRHMEQARRVTQMSGFPAGGTLPRL